ncbi:MAG: lysylphosphatidylglycerol synthase transmembrane domain-containing protein [Chloroflexota bacterium]
MADSTSSRRLVFQIFRWAVTLLALGLVVYLLVNNWPSIWDGVLQIGGGRFALLVLLILISRLMMSLRWYLILRSTDEQVSYPSVLRVTFAGFFANNFMPSTIGGDVFRLTGAVLEGISTAVAAASLLMDRIVGMLGMALILPAGLARLLAYDGEVEIKFGGGAAALAGGLLTRLKAGGGKAVTWFKKVWRKLWETLGLWARRPLDLLPSLLATLIHQLCLYGFIWLILDAFGFQLSWWLIGGLWSLVYFVTLVPVSINGLGVQEVIIIFAYHNMGGASEASALTLALLFRMVMMLVSLPGALAVPALLPEARKSKDL